MPPQTIESRVERLEHRVTELESLPDLVTAVESQIVQLRSEMRDEFSAVRAEFAAVRAGIHAGDEETRRFMRVLHEEVIGRLAVIQEGQPSRGRRNKSSS
jgi:archaellum component FlaC